MARTISYLLPEVVKGDDDGQAVATLYCAQVRTVYTLHVCFVYINDKDVSYYSKQ